MSHKDRAAEGVAGGAGVVHRDFRYRGARSRGIRSRGPAARRAGRAQGRHALSWCALWLPLLLLVAPALARTDAVDATEPEPPTAEAPKAGFIAGLRDWEQRRLEPIGEWVGKLKLGSFSLDGLTLQLSGGLSLGSIGLGHAQASIDTILSTPKGHVESHLTTSTFLSCPLAEVAIFPRAPQRRTPAPAAASGADQAEPAQAEPAAPAPWERLLATNRTASEAERPAAEPNAPAAPSRGLVGRGYDKFKRFGFAGVSLGYFIAATEHPQHGAPFVGLVVHQAFAIFIGRGEARGLFGLYIVPLPFLPMSPNLGFIVSHPRLFASERWERLTTKLTTAHATYKGRAEDWLKHGVDRLRTFPAAVGRTSARAWQATLRARDGLRAQGYGSRPSAAASPGRL
ncbi:MAG: hypothetical protein IPL40_13875 [Proteobacteria bacterium]|nr:hypothetical protein [Pseudomonadota bacterium]